MTSRIPGLSALVALMALTSLVAGVLLLPPAVAQADDEPDTTAPQVRLNPCWVETSCRRVVAEVFGDLNSGDDLAVLGARIGNQVVAEHVFDDGTGFRPYGQLWTYGNDVAISVDYALRVEVPRGTSDIAFYARDLEGNSSELTTTVLGPVSPGPVRRLTAEHIGAHRARVSWTVPDLKGSCCAKYVVTTPGYRPIRIFSGPPSVGGEYVDYERLSRGWHRFTVRAKTTGGTGASRTVRVHIPRERVD